MKMRLCPEADRRQVRLNRILPEKSVVFMTETRIPPESSECQPARRLTKSRPWSESRTVKWRRPALDRPPPLRRSDRPRPIANQRSKPDRQRLTGAQALDQDSSRFQPRLKRRHRFPEPHLPMAAQWIKESFRHSTIDMFSWHSIARVERYRGNDGKYLSYSGAVWQHLGRGTYVHLR